MFRRTFWFTAGAAAGVWATTKVNRKLKQLTPESLAAQAANRAVEAGHRLKDFALDVRSGMLQREAELGEVLGLNTSPDRELPAQPRLGAVERSGPAPIAYLHSKHAPAKPPKAERPQTNDSPTEHSYNRNEDH
ncbi:DUF6167 family protein [Streptomyces sp. NBC_00390]|uniref:DUF6167 family protein n=1 Tax=Streptomyces sp. NBC_00390 TaxID=2975736 RepID=UPI002E20AF2D